MAAPQGYEGQSGVIKRTLDVVFNSVKDFRARWYSFIMDSKNNSVAFRVGRGAPPFQKQDFDFATFDNEFHLTFAHVPPQSAEEAHRMRLAYQETHPEEADLMDVDRSDIDIALRRRSYDSTTVRLDFAFS